MAFLTKNNIEPQAGDTFDAEGNIVNLATTETQELSILNSIVSEGAGNFYLQLSRNRFTNRHNFNSLGKLNTAAAVTNAILALTNPYSIPPAGGVQLTISSTSTSDSSIGTGARTLKIVYLDNLLIEQSEIITLSGTVAVNTIATNIRFIQNIYILTAGTARAAVGTVSFSHTGTTYAILEAGGRRLAATPRMIPSGHNLYIASFIAGAASGNATANCQIKLSSTFFGGSDLTSSFILQPFCNASLQDNIVTHTFVSPIGPIPQGCIVAMEATTDKAAIITGSFFGWLEDLEA